MFNNNELKSAYTLAEILIVIVILGFVSALTLPSVINNYKMKSYEVAFKKEYSVLQNTIDYINYEENIVKCYLSFPKLYTAYNTVFEDYRSLKTALIDELKLSNIDYNANLLQPSVVLQEGGSFINGNYKISPSVNDWYVQKDGIVIWLGHLPNIVFDINGEKAPNKWGYDVFLMHLSPTSSKTKIILTDNLSSVIEKGGRFPRTILRNEQVNYNQSLIRDP